MIENNTNNQPNSYLKTTLRYLLLILSIGYIIYFFLRNKDTLQIAFSIDYLVLTAIIFLHLVYMVVQSWRYQIVIEKCGKTKLPFSPWLRIFILGRFLNLMISQAGNIYRSVQLKKNYEITYTRYISAFTSMFWIDTCMNLLIAIVVVLITNSSFRVGHFVAWKVLTILLLVLFLGPIIADAIFKKIKTNNPKVKWIHGKLSEVLEATIANLHDFSFLSKIFGLGILLFFRTIVTFHLYFMVFETHAPLAALVFFHTILQISFSVILTPGNLGVQEIAFGFLSEQMGISMELGILISGLSRVVSSSILIMAGIAFGGMDLIYHKKHDKT